MTESKHRFDMVTGTQEVFRLLLDALANPGRPVNIRRQAAQFAAHGEWLAPALTLLDNETFFYWDGAPEVGEEIRFLSGGVPAPLEEAGFVFLAGGTAAAEQVLSRVKSGTHTDPHDSALLFVFCGNIVSSGNVGDDSAELTLRGPGIPPEGRNPRLSAAEAEWVRARDAQSFEYPCGVELVFLREDCSLTAITRKAAAEWK